MKPHFLFVLLVLTGTWFTAAIGGALTNQKQQPGLCVLDTNYNYTTFEATVQPGIDRTVVKMRGQSGDRARFSMKARLSSMVSFLLLTILTNLHNACVCFLPWNN